LGKTDEMKKIDENDNRKYDYSRKYQAAWIIVDPIAKDKNKKYFIPRIIILPHCLKKVLSHMEFDPEKIEKINAIFNLKREAEGYAAL